jgi:DNA polymerase III subunit delta
MAILRESELADFLRRKSAQFNGLLLYGNDEAAIATAVRQVVAAMGGGEEPLRLEASSLKSDPAALDDAFRSMSLLGDRRLVIVNGADENHFTHVQSVLEANSLGNFVVFVADSLKKTSKFRSAAESNPLFSAVAFYEEVGGALVQRVQTIARQRGVTFTDEAVERFVDLVGSDRSMLVNEAEKLILYCHPATTVTLDDVEAICGDQAEFESDALIAAVLDGDVEACDRIYASMCLSGDGKSILIMLQMHLARLENVSAAMAHGSDFASACRAARPPIFDKQQSQAQRHLRAFSGDELGRAQVSVQAAILQSRQIGDLGDAITGRCLLSLARMARQLRQRAAA